MASTDYDFKATRNQIIEQAYKLIGVLPPGENLSAELLSEGVFSINEIAKNWGARGVFLWQLKRMSQALVANTSSYLLGGDPPLLNIEYPFLVTSPSTTSTPSTTATIVLDRKSEWAEIMGEFLGYRDSWIGAQSQNCTMTIAAPCVVTAVGHGFDASTATYGARIVFTTTGALPTGLVAGVNYFARYVTVDTFKISATDTGAFITTTGSQSGTHTLVKLDTVLTGTYYDATQCCFRANDILNLPTTLLDDYAVTAATHYNYYVNGLSTPGQLPGYWNFMEGLVEYYLRTSDATTLTAINNIMTNGLYINGSYDVSDDLLSRECAYGITALLHAPRVTGITLTSAQSTRLNTLFGNALGHIDQWCVTKVADYFRPFMGALTANALITWYEMKSEDSRIVPALQVLADYMVETCWVESGTNSEGKDVSNSFTYTDRFVRVDDPVDLEGQPDLNMLIAPLFAFLYAKTGLTKYKDRALLLWEGAFPVYDSYGIHVSGSYLGTRSATNPSGKQIDQQLLYSDLFFKYMEGASTPVEEQVPSPTLVGESRKPLRQISYREYLSIEDKGEAGEPTDVAFSGGASPSLVVYPVPEQTYSVEFTGIAKAKDWDTSDNNGELPSEFEKALIYELAVELGLLNQIPMNRVQFLEDKAKELFFEAKASQPEQVTERTVRSDY